MTPELVVVVATRDRPAALARCLRAVRRQTAADALEVLVVDDGSRDPGTVSAAAAEARAELLRLPRSGLSAARNAGVARATAPFVAFVDDDGEPVENWAASVLRRLHGGAPAVTGPVVAHPAQNPLGQASQLVANSLVDPGAAATGLTRAAPATNLACRIEHARAIPFDASYKDIGAEDRDWCARLSASGAELAFEREAVVRHAQDLTLRDFAYRQYRYGRGAYVYRRRHEHGRLGPPRFYAGLIRDGFATGPAVGVLVVGAQAAAAAGYVREALARRAAVSRRTASEAESRAA